MTQNIKYTSIVILAAIVLSYGFYSLGKRSQVTVTPAEQASSTTQETTTTETVASPVTTTTKPATTQTGTKINTTGFHSYSNSDYNFTIQYPPYVQTRTAFSTFHEIGNNWRLYASSANQGKGLLELSIFSIDQGSLSNGKQKYPLFFTAMVRVSVSPNIKECYTTDAGYSNQKITSITLNGTTWKRFSTHDAAMMKYVQAESYRTIHNNNCFVLEQIKNGSSYRDELMATGIAESTLSGYYDTGATIINTFRFTK